MRTVSDLSNSNGIALPASRMDFIVGRDAEGHWLALETHGLGGGLFVSQDAAVHYAAFETGCRCDAIKVVSEPIRLQP